MAEKKANVKKVKDEFGKLLGYECEYCQRPTFFKKIHIKKLLSKK